MHKIGEEIHIPTSEARGGETPHIMRYVLLFSLLLAILLLSVVWITGAWEASDRTGPSVTAEEHALGG